MTTHGISLPGDRSLRCTRKLLLAALDLTSDRGRFTVRAFARDRYGHELRVDQTSHPRAVRWSGMGALLHAAYTGWGTEIELHRVPAGEPLDLTGPPYALDAIALYEAALTDLFRSKRTTELPRLSTSSSTAKPQSNPVVLLFERMTDPARAFWFAVLVAELPDISRRDVCVAFDTAALLAQNELDREEHARRASDVRRRASPPTNADEGGDDERP